MKITISEEIKNICPNAVLGVLTYTADVRKSQPELKKCFTETISELEKKYSLDEIALRPHISATREAYKALGKAPQEYRNAAEAMLRRIVKGGGLYQINNVVECNNIISVTSGYSIGSYTTENIRGNVELRRTAAGKKYKGIGKELINIEYLPTLFDEAGAFGNPSSDSERAMVTLGRRGIMSAIYSFDGSEGLGEWLDKFAAMLAEYCGAENITTQIVK